VIKLCNKLDQNWTIGRWVKPIDNYWRLNKF